MEKNINEYKARKPYLYCSNCYKRHLHSLEEIDCDINYSNDYIICHKISCKNTFSFNLLSHFLKCLFLKSFNFLCLFKDNLDVGLKIIEFDGNLKENDMRQFWFKCKNDGNYINIAFVCDREENCQFGEDEHNCNYLDYEQFQCDDKSKINYMLVCNFINDCKDESDEKFCGEFFF